MNILYIDHYAGSLSMGMEFRPFYLAREWQKMGHTVRIVGASFSHLRKTNPVVQKDFEIQIIDGIEFQWIKTRSYEGNSISRAITMFQFCSKLWKNAKKLACDFQPDAVIASSTYPLDTYPAQRIRKFSKNCKLVHEGHDIWPLTLTELGGMSKANPFVVLLSIAEKSAYRRSDRVVSVLPNSVEHMLTKGLQNRSKFTYIPNGIVPEDWDNPEILGEEHELYLKKLKKQGKFIVMYIGGHAISNALDIFVEAADNVSDKTIFVLVGNGVEKERLMKKAGEKVIFLPPVRKTQVPTILSYADALYIGAEKCSLYRYGVSMNKVYDYMMAAKPLIYGVEAWNNDVKNAKCGIVIKPNDTDAIVFAVNKLLEMTKDDIEKMGRNGKDFVLEQYSYDILSKTFMDVINS